MLDLEARVPGRTIPLHPLYQGGSARLDGKRSLRGVDAGIGTPDAFAGLDVRGKAVLVTRDDSVQSWERAQAATDAGAALLVVVNDRPGKLYEYGAGTDLPILSLTQAEGAPLLAAARAGRLVLRSRATASPATCTTSSTTTRRASPPTRRSRRRRRTSRGSTSASSASARTSPSRAPRLPLVPVAACIGWYEPIKTRSTRIDYVTTQPGVTWYRGRDPRRRLGAAPQQMQYHAGPAVGTTGSRRSRGRASGRASGRPSARATS